jgi:glucose-1-phosphate thymidylyltransferase
LLQPSSRGEREITDLNNIYINRKKLKFNILKSWWLDAGTHESLFKANKHFYERS